MLNALSIDLEEYYHAEIFRRGANGNGHSVSHARCPMPGAWPSRVEESTHRVLGLLSESGVKATFFVVGEVAKDHPELIRDVARQGHEIACHSYRHECVYNLSPNEFREDLRQAKGTLEEFAGKAVIGYRAPNFSIGLSEQWAYDILLEEGFQYDSSLFPIRHDRYGDHTAPRFPFALSRHGKGKLMEFPIGTRRLFGTNFPISGGGYFRLFPTKLFELGIQRVNEKENMPIMFYFHPWELDPDQPRPPLALHHRFRLYVGMEREEAKLLRLFAAVKFTTAREVLGLTNAAHSSSQLSVVSSR